MLKQRMAFEVDLAQAVETTNLPNVLIKGDANAHEVCVTVKRGGEPVDLTGVDAKGFGVVDATVTVAQGETHGSVASFTLGEGFYQRSGTITLLLTLTLDDVETTVFRAVGQILDSGSGRTVVDPDAVLGWEALQRVAREAEALIASMDRAEQAAQEANQAAQTANHAAQGANSAAQSANSAAQRANSAAQGATSAAEGLRGDLDAMQTAIDRQKQVNHAQDRRLENLEYAARGYLYRSETDSAPAYTKTVPADVMPWATLDKIGGKTLVWNQILPNGNFESLNGWLVFSSEGATVENNIVTISADRDYGGIAKKDFSVISGHRYYVSVMAKFDRTDEQIFYPMYTSGAIAANYDYTYPQNTDWNLYALVEEAKSEKLDFGVRMSTIEHGEIVTILVKNFMLFDLTAMFGDGNEPTTAEEFRAMFPADYYPYSEPTLMDFSSSAVVSSAGSMLDTSAIVRKYFPDGMKSAGTAHDEIDWDRMVAIRRVGVLDESWRSIAVQSINRYGIANFLFNNVETSDHGNAFSMLKKQNTNIADTQDEGYLLSSNCIYIRLKSTSASTVDALKQYLASNKIAVYYELAEPIETPITEAFDASIEVEAGGSLTLVNDQGEDYRVPVPNQQTRLIKLGGAN